MTVVDRVVDAEIVDLTTDQAETITGRIRTWVKDCPVEDVKRAYFGRIWLAMGYESWSEWCDCELDGFKLPAVERREIVGELAESGMSGRAIADVAGVSRETVRRDLADTNVSPDSQVTGKDGKTYPAKREKEPDPAPPLPEPGLSKGADAVRDWARRNGFSVSQRGRVPAEIIAEYNLGESGPADDKPSSGEVVDPEPVPDCAAAEFAAALRELKRRLDNIKINATLEQIKEVQTLLYQQAGSLRWHVNKLSRDRTR